MTNRRHIILTGFMGSGKSTYGKKLAALMKLDFFDLDTHIEKNENQSISLIFENIGEEAFRNLESTYLKSLLKEKQPMVLALGGGTVCFYDNLQQVKENGLLIYLQLTAAALYNRILSRPGQRPLLKDYKGEELLAYIEKKLEIRENYYKQAHLTINGLNLTAQQLQQSILEFNQKNNF